MGHFLHGCHGPPGTRFLNEGAVIRTLFSETGRLEIDG